MTGNKNNDLTGNVVNEVPTFLPSTEPGADEVRVLSEIEKANLRELIQGADEVELKYMLRYIKADLMRSEISRRDDLASHMVEELRAKTRNIPSRMEYEEMMALINDVRSILKIGGQEYGN